MGNHAAPIFIDTYSGRRAGTEIFMEIKREWSFRPYDPVLTDVFGNPWKSYQFLITDLQTKNGRVFVVWQPVELAERYNVMLVPFGENANSTSDGISTVMKETEKSQAVLTDVMNDVLYELQINTFYGGKREGKALSR